LQNYLDRDIGKRDNGGNGKRCITNQYHKRKQNMLRIAPTTVQKWAVVRIEDYGWKESNESVGKVLLTRENDILGGT
jgi:hypothetical protein